jgi:uncharacterized membrane protein YeaQ/YmgE (transglycosylase-associated protein family)
MTRPIHLGTHNNTRGCKACQLLPGSGDGVIIDIVLGIVGALAGGWLFNRCTGAPSLMLGPAQREIP